MYAVTSCFGNEYGQIFGITRVAQQKMIHADDLGLGIIQAGRYAGTQQG